MLVMVKLIGVNFKAERDVATNRVIIRNAVGLSKGARAATKISVLFRLVPLLN
jgi:hypothetical protein